MATRRWPRWPTPLASTASPGTLFDDFLALDADGSDRHRLPRPRRARPVHVRLGRSDRAAMLPVLGTVCRRAKKPPRTPPHWEKRSSSPTSCETSTKTCNAAGSICLPTSWPLIDVDRDVLMWCHTHKRTDARVRRALIDQHAETRRIYDFARDGIALLHPRSRPCIAAALTLYSEILDRIEELDFAVFSQRATVGTYRRLAGRRQRPGQSVGRASARCRGRRPWTAGSICSSSARAWPSRRRWNLLGDRRVSACLAHRRRRTSGRRGLRRVGCGCHRRPRLDLQPALCDRPRTAGSACRSRSCCFLW